MPAYQALLTSVAQTVSAQPLNFLQNFGGTSDAFIYERTAPGQITLKPGVAYCLRRFRRLVQQLCRSHWMAHIKQNRRNSSILGQADDLEDFLFGASRQSLLAMGQGLRRIDGARCFYCAQALTASDVDHFIPFSQYPRDLAHNFVLAHPSCNRSKSATLPAPAHLERWLERNIRRTDAIQEVAVGSGLLMDADVSFKVVQWSYTTAIKSGASSWLSPGRYEAIDEHYGLYFNHSRGVRQQRLE